MTCALVNTCFNFSNAFCCLGPQFHSTSFLVSLSNGSAIVAKFGMYFMQKLTSPRKLRTSAGDFGLSNSCTAWILLLSGYTPSLDKVCPMNFNSDLLNSNLSLFNVRFFFHGTYLIQHVVFCHDPVGFWQK